MHYLEYPRALMIERYFSPKYTKAARISLFSKIKCSQVETFHTPEFTTDCYDTIIPELIEKANTTEFAPESARRYLELLEIQKEIITKINDMHGMHYDNFVIYRIVIRIDSEVWNRDRSGIIYRDMNPNEMNLIDLFEKTWNYFILMKMI